MKKKLIIGITSLALICMVFLSYRFLIALQAKNKTEQLLQTLPDFHLQSLDSLDFSKREIKPDQWTVFVFFDPDCHYCEEEAIQLKENIQSIKNTRFLWVTNETQDSIVKFQQHFGLDKHPKIVFLKDEKAQLMDQWGVSTIPYFLVYDPKKELVFKHKGAYRIDRLINQINNGFKEN